MLGVNMLSAQDRTTVRANNIDISDNLDLRAVAHIFGESSNLEDFENRLNDPNLQISNLDLNGDNQVDYLRVLESAEESTHLIIIQAVLGRDLFQDVATIEVEKDRRNKTVQVQVVGDVYLYGSNYIYEPVYYYTPRIYTHFWVPNYVVYYSPWFWNYYPGYYNAWNPYPIYRYRNNVNVYINVNNTCHYVQDRRSRRAVSMHQTRRSAGYEALHPNRSFSVRNQNISNRHELVEARSSRSNSRNLAVEPANRNSEARNQSNATRNTSVEETRTRTTLSPDRNSDTRAGQSASTLSGTSNTIRSRSNATVSEPVRSNTTQSTISNTGRNATSTNTVRSSSGSQSVTSSRNTATQSQSATRSIGTPTRNNVNTSVRGNSSRSTTTNISRTNSNNSSTRSSSGSQIKNSSSVRGNNQSNSNTTSQGRRN